MTGSMALSSYKGPVVLIGLAALYRCWVRYRSSRSIKKAAKPIVEPAADKSVAPRKDLRRKGAVAHGGAVDNHGYAQMVEDPDFDLNQTIFRKMRGPITRYLTHRKLCQVPHWSDAAVDIICAEFDKLPPPPPVDRRLTEFMLAECNFVGEHHADGSFMDHLAFCHDYCAVHYSAVSPRVMLLHSIMGVGTNLFPMEASKVPKLAELLTPVEMKHVECFPSILRLLLSHSLIDDLEQMGGDVGRLRCASFRRVLDNGHLELLAEELWVQLNYQLVHLVDFVPVADWTNGCEAPAFQVFVRLYRLLSRAGQLRAKVALRTALGGQLTADDVEACERASLRGPWNSFNRRTVRGAIAQFSKNVGHSLEYQLTWSDV